jgi:hypothetical protein
VQQRTGGTAAVSPQGETIMIRNAILAGLVAFGAAGTVDAAQASDVRLSGGGNDMTIEYTGPAPHENVLGGAVATITGGGVNTDYRASRVITVQPGRDATLVGGGEDARVVVREPRAPRG